MRTATGILRRALAAFAADKASTFAAAIAYHTLFSIFPFSLFLISFAGYFLTHSQRNRLVNAVAGQLGGSSTGQLERQIRLATNGRAGLTLLGLAIALWSAAAVFGAVRNGLSTVWSFERRHSWMTAKAQDLASVVGYGGLLTLSLSGTFAFTTLSVLARRILGVQLGSVAVLFMGMVFLFLPFILAFLTFGLLFLVSSPPAVGWRDVWPGAVVAAVGFQAVSLGFSFFVSSVGHFDKVYGSLGTVIAFLFYAYIVGSLLLFGAEVAKQAVYARSPGKLDAGAAAAAADREETDAYAMIRSS